MWVPLGNDRSSRISVAQLPSDSKLTCETTKLDDSAFIEKTNAGFNKLPILFVSDEPLLDWIVPEILKYSPGNGLAIISLTINVVEEEIVIVLYDLDTGFRSNEPLKYNVKLINPRGWFWGI